MFLGWEGGAPTDSQPVQPPQPGDHEQHANVHVTLKNNLIEVTPGRAESATFTIKNLGTQVEEFGLAVTGPEWIVAEPATISVYPGQEMTGTVQAAPPRKPSSAAGIAPFRLTATSTLHAHVSSSDAGRVDVAANYELAAELVPTSSSGRGLTRHQVQLDNRGNVPLRVGLNPADMADGLRLGVQAFADVAPGQVVEVPVTVRSSRRWFGRSEPRTFAIVAEPPKPLAATRLPGTRIVVPMFPRWVPVAAAGLAVVAAAAAVLVPKLTEHKGESALTGSASATAQSSATSPASVGVSSSSGTSPSATTGAGAGGAGAGGAGAGGAGAGAGSPVLVPDVTGSSLADAEAAISGKNLKPQPQADWVSPPAIAGHVVRTDPTAGASASPGSTVQAFAPTGTDELMPVSQSASWVATSELNPPSSTLAFGGSENDSSGAVLLTGPVTLANGVVITQALETHPPPLTNAFIKGVYPLSQATIGGEQFRADLGFRQGTGGTIQYQVIVIDGNGSQQVKANGTLDAAHSQVAQVIADLPVGTAKVAVAVMTLDSNPANDDVIWVNPRIEEANAPAEPLQPTAPASPTPSGP